MPMTVVSVLACLASPPGATAGDRSDESPWRVRGIVGATYTDNVRWAPDGPNREDTLISKLHVTAGVHDKTRGLVPDAYELNVTSRWFSSFSERDFVEIGAWSSWDLGDTDVSVAYNYVPEKLGKEIDDSGDSSFFQRHEIEAAAKTRFGPGRRGRFALRASADQEIYEQESNFRDAVSPHFSAGLRYRIFSWLSPEVRYTYGWRDAARDDLDRNETELRAGATVHAHERLTVRVLYTLDRRDYTVSFDRSGDGSRNKNIARDDSLDEYQVMIAWRPASWEGATLSADWHLRDGRSDRDSRNFDVTEVTLSLKQEF